MHGFHEGPVIPVADVGKHGDRGDLVELALHVAIIAAYDVYILTGTVRAGVAHLLFSNVDACHSYPVICSGIKCELAPTSAHLEQVVSGMQVQFAANQVQLETLGFVQGAGTRIIAATVVSVMAQKRAEEVVVEVVMPAGSSL